jgi:hypothetical protein
LLGKLLGMDVGSTDGQMLGRIESELLGKVLGMKIGSTVGVLLGRIMGE